MRLGVAEAQRGRAILRQTQDERGLGGGVVTTCFVILNLVQDPFCRLGLRLWGGMDPEPSSG